MTAIRWRLAADVAEGIRARPARTALALLALAVGIAAWVVLSAVLDGLDHRSRAIVRELGIQVFGIIGDEGSAGGRHYFGRNHVDFLAANLEDCRVSGVLVDSLRVPGDRSAVGVVATDANLRHVRGWRRVEGRFLEQEDIRTRARVVVLSREVSRQWQRHVGEVVTLRGLPFRIVGVVDSGAGGGAPEVTRAGAGLGSRLLFVPWSAPAPWREGKTRRPAVEAVYVRGHDEPAYGRALSRSIRLLRQPDQAVAGLSWVTPDVLLDGIRRLQRTIRWTAGSVAALCLLLGGVTLMSLMVANVRDRVPEIGLRRALGATGGDIAALFVTESLVVTGLAALVGTLSARILLLPVGGALPVPVHIGWPALVAPGLGAVLLGSLFSLAPARLAARIVPSEALRNE